MTDTSPNHQVITGSLSADMASDSPRHPIQVVVRRTGLSADVIRVWERRYEAVTPAREARGRRVYSDDDIKRLSLLQKVTDAGRRISEVAKLDIEALLALHEDDQKAQHSLLGPRNGGESGNAALVESAFRAVLELNTSQLRKVISVASSQLPQIVFLEQVISPLLVKVGTFWHSGEIRVAQEHLASVTIRQYLHGQLKQGHPQARPIIMTTPSGHHHDIGVLMAALVAETDGWRAIFLGADIPASEIAAATLQSHAQVVTLGVQFTTNPQAMANEIHELRMCLPDEVEIMVSGPAAIEHASLLAETKGIVVPTNLTEFRELLAKI